MYRLHHEIYKVLGACIVYTHSNVIENELNHYCDVIMGAIVSQITSLAIGYSTVYSDADQRKLQSSAPLAFVRGIQRGPVNSPHKSPVTGKMFLLDDVIMSMVFRMSLYAWLTKCREISSAIWNDVIRSTNVIQNYLNQRRFEQTYKHLVTLMMAYHR